MNAIENPVRYAVAEEIMAAITASPTPLCAQQLLSLCDSADTADRIAKSLYSLKKSGRLVEDDPIATKSGPRKTYRLPTDKEELMTHLEAELTPNAIRFIESAAPENCLDRADCSCNGDEPMKIPPVHTVDDPVIAAIERLSEPHWLGGRQDAERLRALAQCAPIARSVDVVAYLTELADRFEAMSR